MKIVGSKLEFTSCEVYKDATPEFEKILLPEIRGPYSVMCMQSMFRQNIKFGIIFSSTQNIQCAVFFEVTALQYSKRNSSFRQESCLWVNYGLAISDIETGYKPSTIRSISYYSLYLHRRLQIPYMLVVKEDVKELFLV